VVFFLCPPLPSNNEHWIVDAGAAVIEKKSATGAASLSLIERLVHCLWVADYGMRNAGDLTGGRQIHSQFQEDAARLSETLGLEFTHASFSLTPSVLQAEYFERCGRLTSVRVFIYRTLCAGVRVFVQTGSLCKRL
jgi:hypothetical protein